MTTSIVVRGLDEAVKARLAEVAKENGRSMEAEVRDILTRAARRPNVAVALIRAVGAVGGVDEVPWPTRGDEASGVDFA